MSDNKKKENTEIDKKTEIEQLQDQINQLQELIKNLETYIKVIGVEDYKKVIEYNIDYSKISYLQSNSDLKEKLTGDCIFMVRNRWKDNFSEFCRFACLQIELIVDYFIRYQEKMGVIQVDRINLKNTTAIKSITLIENRDEPYISKYSNFLPLSDKVKFCCDMLTTNNNKSKIENLEKIINNLITDERNLASHRSSSDIELI